MHESKLSHVAARFEYQQFSESAPMRLQVCLHAFPPHFQQSACAPSRHLFSVFAPRPRVLRARRSFSFSSIDESSNPTGRKQQSNWQGSGMNEHERECHERARARTSTSLHCCVCHASFAVAWGVGSQVWGLSDSTHDMNPKARKQQSTEHERLRRDGSSIQLMCTSTGTHEGFWKRMGLLI